MRALVLDRELAYRADYPDSAPRQDESIIEVTLAGICGTDLELARGYMKYRGVPGHEFVGRVIQSGDSSLRGQRVVGEINAGCGRCDACLRSDARHCRNRTVLGILRRDGAFAERLALPDRNLRAIPDSVPDELAVFAEPLAAAYEVFEQVRILRNQELLVLGDGRLGAMVALALRAEGYEAIVAGHHAEKMSRLAKLGIATAFEPKLDTRFDCAIDCTGSADGFKRALELVRPRGTIVLKSTAAADAPLNLAPVVINEITVVGSRCGRFAPALDALASGRIDPRPLIDGVFPLQEGLAAMRAASDPLNFKILLSVS